MMISLLEIEVSITWYSSTKQMRAYNIQTCCSFLHQCIHANHCPSVLVYPCCACCEACCCADQTALIAAAQSSSMHQRQRTRRCHRSKAPSLSMTSILPLALLPLCTMQASCPNPSVALRYCQVMLHSPQSRRQACARCCYPSL